MPRHAPTVSSLIGVLGALCLLGTDALPQPLTLDVAHAAADIDQRTKESILRIALTRESAIALGKYTADRVGQTMEVRREGRLIISAVIREPILGGSFQISGQLTLDRTAELASQLPAGSEIEVEAAGAK